MKKDRALRRKEGSSVSTPVERSTKMRADRRPLGQLIKRTVSGSSEKKVVMTRT